MSHDVWYIEMEHARKGPVYRLWVRVSATLHNLCTCTVYVEELSSCHLITMYMHVCQYIAVFSCSGAPYVCSAILTEMVGPHTTCTEVDIIILSASVIIVNLMK